MVSAGVAVIAFVTTAFGFFAFVTDALELRPTGRRKILQQGGAAFAVAATAPVASAFTSLPREDDDDDLRQIFRSLYPTKKKGQPAPQSPPTIEWSPHSKDFSKLRYSTSWRG